MPGRRRADTRCDAPYHPSKSRPRDGPEVGQGEAVQVEDVVKLRERDARLDFDHSSCSVDAEHLHNALRWRGAEPTRKPANRCSAYPIHVPQRHHDVVGHGDVIGAAQTADDSKAAGRSSRVLEHGLELRDGLGLAQLCRLARVNSSPVRELSRHDDGTVVTYDVRLTTLPPPFTGDTKARRPMRQSMMRTEQYRNHAPPLFLSGGLSGYERR